jgi:hypothetical protein
MPSAEQYTIWVHDRWASTHGLFPMNGKTSEEVLVQLLDLPTWADSVYVYDVSDRQVFFAFVNRQASQREHRVALDVLVVPASWAESLPDRPRRTGSSG